MGKFHCLLVNIGSPSTPDRKGVATFLRKFLMDKYVMQIPWLLRLFIVNVFIIPKRSEHAAAKYREIWGENGSPLAVNMQNIASCVQKMLNLANSDVEVSFAMRYGENSIKERITKLKKSGVERLFVIPMYPQYEKSTHLTTIEEVKRNCDKLGVQFTFLKPFCYNSDYLSLISQFVSEKIVNIHAEKIIFSYHSVPLSYLPCGETSAMECSKTQGYLGAGKMPCCRDCYKFQCFATTENICREANIDKGKYITLFQSKMGHNEWIEPLLEPTLERFASEGIKSVAVVSPSFVSDCLETLMEINIEGRETFLSNGGENFYYIPALNDDARWATLLERWILSHEVKKST